MKDTKMFLFHDLGSEVIDARNCQAMIIILISASSDIHRLISIRRYAKRKKREKSVSIKTTTETLAMT